LAPEILNEKGHSFPVDWWAVGILTYEMIVGFPPFYTGTNNNLKMYELIKKKPVYFPDPVKHKIVMTDDCKDFISKVTNIFIYIKFLFTHSLCSYWRKILKIDWDQRMDCRRFCSILGLLT
jgi:serine/threonine protein kinase